MLEEIKKAGCSIEDLVLIAAGAGNTCTETMPLLQIGERNHHSLTKTLSAAGLTLSADETKRSSICSITLNTSMGVINIIYNSTPEENFVYTIQPTDLKVEVRSPITMRSDVRLPKY